MSDNWQGVDIRALATALLKDAKEFEYPDKDITEEKIDAVEKWFTDQFSNTKGEICQMINKVLEGN